MGDKKNLRGRGSTMDDAMPSSPSALFSCALTYSFLCFNHHIGLSEFSLYPVMVIW